MNEVTSVDVEARRVGITRHARVRVLSKTGFALMLGACVAAMVMSSLYPEAHSGPKWWSVVLGLSFIASIGSMGLAFVSQIGCWIGPLARGRISVDPAGVRIDGGWFPNFVPSREIETGCALRSRDGPRVELRLRNGNVLGATVNTIEEANAVLDAANVEPARRALKMTTGSALTSIAIGLAALVAGICPAGIAAVTAENTFHLSSPATGFMIFSLLTVAVFTAVKLVGSAAVSVGSDGVSVQAGLENWFAPWAQILSVEPRQNAISLVLANGSIKSISMTGTSAPRREALLERIMAGLDERRGSELSGRLVALDRNGRSVEEWRAALQELASGGENYRSARPTRAEIIAALEDPQSTPERRIGAAFALASSDRDDAGGRVRVLAEAVAHEPVRIALERAAAGEIDDELVAELTQERSMSSHR